MSLDCTVVVPTIGRPSLERLLTVLDACDGTSPAAVIVVDDRADRTSPLCRPKTGLPVRVLSSSGGGPAAARNAGWRAARTNWIAFLDDDVLPDPGWLSALADDLTAAEAASAAGSQGTLVVPASSGPLATDDERRTHRLADARWITADMVYRRDVLVAVGGFDARFPRAYREDSDIALRIVEAGHRIIRGGRCCTHPVAPGTLLGSVRAQIGNRDNALMRRKFGSGWRRRVGEGPGRLPAHAATSVAALSALVGLPMRRRFGASVCAALWTLLWVEFTVRRFRSGPRSAAQLARLALTSALIPPVAVWHRLVGEWTHRGAGSEPVLAVLLDRDDTLIEDGPFLNDPDGVRPLADAPASMRRLRAHGLLLAVVTNQSGVARGLISLDQLCAVNADVDAVLGPFDSWQVCVHDDADDCGCRKPAPGMVLAAADALGVPPHRCVLIGDTGSDVEAALAARARAVLVPTGRTRGVEIVAAHRTATVAPTLADAVSLVLQEAR